MLSAGLLNKNSEKIASPIQVFFTNINNRIPNFDRLYSIVLEKWIKNTSTWECRAILYDLQKLSIESIVNEIANLIQNQAGSWRISVNYWSGPINVPPTIRHMGKGESFLYSPNPKGDVILKIDPPLVINV